MKAVFILIMMGLSCASLAKLVRVTPTSAVIRRGKAFGLDLKFNENLNDVAAIAVELKPLTSGGHTSVAYTQGDFAPGQGIRKGQEYHFKDVVIPARAPLGWWRVDVIVIKDDSDIADQFLYEAAKALKVCE